jgi:hypothetical protein
MNRAMAMKKKKKREVRAIRAFPALLLQQPFAARIRRWARLAALRRYRALSGVHVPDPVRFYPVRSIDVNVGPSRPRGNRRSFTQKRAHRDVAFARNGRFEASFRAIRYRKIAKVVLNVFKTQVAAGADGRVEFERAVSASLRAC